MNMSLARLFIYLVCSYFFTNLGNVAELPTEKQALYYLLLLAVFIKIELRLIPNAEQLVDLIHQGPNEAQLADLIRQRLHANPFIVLPAQNPVQAQRRNLQQDFPRFEN